jgi:integrase/recombinase XerD
MLKFNSILKDEIYDFMVLREASKSKCTYSHDKFILRGFDEYLCSISCNNKNLTEQQLTGWVHSLSGKTGSIANQVIVLRIFLTQQKSYGIHSYIPPVPKVHDDYIPYIFSETELDSIFHYADSLEKTNCVQKNTLIHLEIPMILRLMYGCGLRVGETLSLRIEDVDLATGVLTLKNSKMDKQRLVPMHYSLTEILEHYCMAMGIIGFGKNYLFPTSNPVEPVTPPNTRIKFNFLLKMAEIPLRDRKKYQRGPCLHCLRHVFVFKSFANAENDGRRIDDTIPYLSIYLGHDSLRETEKYLKFSSELFPQSIDLFGEYTKQIFPEVNYDE